MSTGDLQDNKNNNDNNIDEPSHKKRKIDEDGDIRSMINTVSLLSKILLQYEKLPETNKVAIIAPSKRALEDIVKVFQKELEDNRNNGEFLFDDASIWFNWLNPISVLNLASTCSNIFKRFSPLRFRALTKFQKYNPQNFSNVIRFDDIPCGSKNLILSPIFECTKAPLPESVTHLTIPTQTFKINQLRIIDILSKSNLTYLVMPSNFSYCYDSLSFFPSSLLHLSFGSSFYGHPDPGLQELPSSLTYLDVGDSYSCPILNFPTSLTHLVLGNKFKDSLDGLPSSLISLKIGCKFNQPISNLPQGLKQLIFAEDSRFNQPVDNLPPSLTTLEMGLSFNQPVDKLPSSLTSLCLPRLIYQSIDNLPRGLTHLVLGGHFNQPISNLNLPSGLISLHIGNRAVYATAGFPNFKITSVPENLKHLHLYIQDYATIQMILLPNSLTTFGTNCNWFLQNLKFPSNLQKVVFTGDANLPKLPPSVQIIKTLTCQHPIVSLPPNLREFHVRLSDSDLELPPTLQVLKIHQSLKPLPSLPHSLTSLSHSSRIEYGEMYCVPSFPPSLTSLKLFGCRDLTNLPAGLSKLTLQDGVTFKEPTGLRKLKIVRSEDLLQSYKVISVEERFPLNRMLISKFVINKFR